MIFHFSGVADRGISTARLLSVLGLADHERHAVFAAELELLYGLPLEILFRRKIVALVELIQLGLVFSVLFVKFAKIFVSRQERLEFRAVGIHRSLLE
jgi:hypothetical protein